MTPDAWSAKDERKYRAIKSSLIERGRELSQAEEIAARTVNKQRRRERRTKSGKVTSSGTGNPNVNLEQRTKTELYDRARQLDIKGRSRMSKSELVRAVRRAQ